MNDVPGLQTGSRAEADLEPGRYRHFKGREYELLAVARDTETGELVVVYRATYDPDQTWVRPLAMFVEPVRRGDRVVPRFQKVDVSPPPFLPSPQPLLRVAQRARQLFERSILRVVGGRSRDPLSASRATPLRIPKRDVTPHS